MLVQALLSLQVAVLLAWVQPLTLSQASVVHGLPSSQLGAGPPRQLPFRHLSAVVQALRSSQLTVLLVLVQPLMGSQASLVHALPSSQLGAAPPLQAPAFHLSLVVQALLSSQLAKLFDFSQPVSDSQ